MWSRMQKRLTGYFNPRTHEGYDSLRDPLLFRSQNFNPRTHEGYDDMIPSFRPSIKSISIHVPTKGTTSYNILCITRMTYFNPRTHEGYDAETARASAEAKNFNPRTHEGYD